MATTTRWVRYVVPIMVEIDCDDDRIGRIVALPEEARPDRDDLGQFCVYDQNFVRHHADGPIETHAYWVANPPSGCGLPGPPQDWPDMMDWEEGFDVEPDDEGVAEEDRYAEIQPYAEADRTEQPT